MAEVTTSQYFEVGEPLVLIYISRTLAAGLDVYEAVRRAWPANLNRVVNQDGSYKLVLARDGKKVVGAFRPTRWYRDHEILGRKAFDGEPAEHSVWVQYVEKLVPERFLPPGSRNPVRYFEPGD